MIILYRILVFYVIIKFFIFVVVIEVVEEKMIMIIIFLIDIINEYVGFFLNYKIVVNILLNIICCEIIFLF